MWSLGVGLIGRISTVLSLRAKNKGFSLVRSTGNYGRKATARKRGVILGGFSSASRIGAAIW